MLSLWNRRDLTLGGVMSLYCIRTACEAFDAQISTEFTQTCMLLYWNYRSMLARLRFATVTRCSDVQTSYEFLFAPCYPTTPCMYWASTSLLRHTHTQTHRERERERERRTYIHTHTHTHTHTLIGTSQMYVWFTSSKIQLPCNVATTSIYIYIYIYIYIHTYIHTVAYGKFSWTSVNTRPITRCMSKCEVFVWVWKTVWYILCGL